MFSPTSFVEFVKHAARNAGMDLAGVAPLWDYPELRYFRRWIADGRGGEMRYLEAREDGGELKRVAVQQVFPWAKSVVVCAVNYYAGESPPASLPDATESNRGRGWISRYAQSRQDYHRTVMERLKRLESALHEAAGDAIQTRSYVDTGPLVERVYARYAGIGWVGKNTCIINQQLGSWSFLGIIVTSIDVLPVAPGHLQPGGGNAAPDRCGTCTRCLDACPTQAFPGPYQLDASRCISYLTIEKRGEVPEDLRAGIGRHVFGCDICQEVCPWNRKAPVTSTSEWLPEPQLVNPDLEWLAFLGEEEFRAVFRGSPLLRAKRTGIRRNAVIAMGNSQEPRFLPALERLAKDEDPVVASHAEWALRKLREEVREESIG